MMWLAVAAGGALGATLRWLIVRVLPHSGQGMPIGVFSVNVLGCAVLGTLVALEARGIINLGAYGRTFMVVGLLGALTTFSSFALEFNLLAGKHEWGLAMLYMVLSVGLSLTAFAGAYGLCTMIGRG